MKLMVDENIYEIVKWKFVFDVVVLELGVYVDDNGDMFEKIMGEIFVFFFMV